MGARAQVLAARVAHRQRVRGSEPGVHLPADGGVRGGGGVGRLCTVKAGPLVRDDDAVRAAVPMEDGLTVSSRMSSIAPRKRTRWRLVTAWY